MNSSIIVFVMVALVTSTNPMKQPEVNPDALPKEEIEQQYCFSCYEQIPDQHSHFKYTCGTDHDHLICTHCYFYRIPKSADQKLEYVSKNDMDKNKEGEIDIWGDWDEEDE